VPHLEASIREATAGWALKPRILVDLAEKWSAYRRARAALAASGTVTLELALAGVPMVAAYRLPLVEEIILRLLLVGSELRSVILANLLIGENVVPEFLQRACTPENLAQALLPLLSDTPQRRRQTGAFDRLDEIMKLGTAPSARAAAIVLDVARRGRRDPAAGAPRAP